MACIARLLVALIGLLPLASHALYDPPPAAALAGIEGAWQGTLQYRNWQPPHQRVTLPTRLFVAAASPKELALHYVFNDGPGKTVHSYDRLLIDLEAATLRFSGAKPEDTSTARIVGQRESDGFLEITAERTEVSKDTSELLRYRLRLGPTRFEILKTAVGKDAEGEFRNEYVFKR